jgi:hypothetical protein
MELHLLSRHAAVPALLAALAVVLSSSCEERIRIDTGASAPRLVIYGYLTTDTLEHTIRITRSSDYFSTGRPEGISGARVEIRHNEEAWPLAESPAEPGAYRTAAGVAGQAGETYTLHVSLDFDGDGQAEAYEASCVLPPAAQLESMAVEPSRLSEQHLEALIWGRLPEQEAVNYFNLRLYINGRLLNDSLQGYSINSDEYLQTKRIEGLSVFFLNQQRESSELHSGDSLTLQIESLTGDFARFITNAQSERRGSLPLFSAPPANIETNIRPLTPSDAPVSGFFTAFSVNRTGMIYR